MKINKVYQYIGYFVLYQRKFDILKISVANVTVQSFFVIFIPCLVLVLKFMCKIQCFSERLRNISRN